MDWKTIEETYKHFNKDWAHYQQDYCIEDQIPSYKDRFQNVQDCKEDDSWVNSTHPFCKSCYSLYSQVCENVGTFFNIGKNWKKENLDNKLNLFIETYLDKPLDESIEMYEAALLSFIDCINARWFQHESCFKSKNQSNINNTVDVANPSHMHFILLLCLQVKKLYSLYKNMIILKTQQVTWKNETKHTKSPLPKDILKDHNPNIIDICRNVIKNYGNKSEKDKINEIFNSNSKENISRRKSKSPERNSKNKKQSRNKNAYRPPPGTINKLNKRK